MGEFGGVYLVGFLFGRVLGCFGFGYRVGAGFCLKLVKVYM